MRLFADDSILYREINSVHDQETLQNDLNTVFAWADKWQMSFNASKCQLLTITRKTKPRNHIYTVADQTIEKTNHHKYLGVTISHNLMWTDHIAKVRSKACSTLGIIRRNLGPCGKEIKLRAYQALVRPQLEYAAAAWNPHTSANIQSLEAVQRQAVRFICGEYGRFTSVTPLREQLKLDKLETRRLMSQCFLQNTKCPGKCSIPVMCSTPLYNKQSWSSSEVQSHSGFKKHLQILILRQDHPNLESFAPGGSHSTISR